MRSMYWNSVTISCRMLSTKSIKDLKAAKMDDTTLMSWLKAKQVYLEANTLGMKTICMLGYLFPLHPQMTHHGICKGIIQEAITDIKIIKEEILAIDLNDLEYYHSSDDSQSPDDRERF